MPTEKQNPDDPRHTDKSKQDDVSRGNPQNQPGSTGRRPEDDPSRRDRTDRTDRTGRNPGEETGMRNPNQPRKPGEDEDEEQTPGQS